MNANGKCVPMKDATDIMNTLKSSKPLSGCLSSESSPPVSLVYGTGYRDVLFQTMKFVHEDRDLLLHDLMEACGFLTQKRDEIGSLDRKQSQRALIRLVDPQPATRRQLEEFHESHYLDVLETNSQEQSAQQFSSSQVEILDDYGLLHDCPFSENAEERQMLWNYCLTVAGASLTATQELVRNRSICAINWGGGRHHGQPGKASGFCYINDTVLAIKRMQKHYHKILYLDVDIHHADGVQAAFYATDTVMTVSFHRFGEGFFPATGSTKEKGQYKTPGVGYNLNLPLPENCNDFDFLQIFSTALQKLSDSYHPEAIVLAIGADGLQGDPVVTATDKGWNLSPEALAECVKLTVSSLSCETTGSCDRKLLILGGGGYCAERTARTFLLCTAAACQLSDSDFAWTDLPKTIPEELPSYLRFGPQYLLINERTVDAIRKGQRENNEGGSNSPNGVLLQRYSETLKESSAALDVTSRFLQLQQKKFSREPTFAPLDIIVGSGRSSNGGRNRKIRKRKRSK